MPSDDELKTYSKRLPKVYRDILSAYSEIEPHREPGHGLAFQTLAAYFANAKRGYSFDEVKRACNLLAENAFLDIKNGIFAHPTELGERLIAAVTGRPVASHSPIPQLPARTW